ncbi:MAG TPA: winged helix-turn-helix domain-containing protein [Nitrososphaeraceae archaeon]|jgi:predicted transcriptional regulator|nr:winged helix-turn-helix domain-containing protein [Nitrososphaeraceae archaeon]
MTSANTRNRTEIISTILETCKGSSKRAEIMFASYLPFEQVNEYLDELVMNGLLAYNPHKRVYNLTSKGSRFLEFQKEIL